MEPLPLDRLVRLARETLANAYAPYSRFNVGAALETDTGEVFTGCNVENASFGLTICAEQNAVAAAVSRGRRRFRRLVVVTAGQRAVAPCGRCRQVLAEFGTDVMIYGVANGESVHWQLKDLIPDHFGRDSLDAGPAGGEGAAPSDSGSR